MIIGSIVIVDILKSNFPNIGISFDNLKLNSMKSFVAVMFSYEIFIFFKYMNIKNKNITKLSKNCLKVYLIHENLFLRPIIWNKILHGSLFTNSWFIIIHAIVSILFVYILCTMISYGIDKITSPIQKIFSKFMNYLLKLKKILLVFNDKINSVKY